MDLFKTFLIFAVTAVAEIVGCRPWSKGWLAWCALVRSAAWAAVWPAVPSSATSLRWRRNPCAQVSAAAEKR